MYHIIGADGQPRGPIDSATLTRWITEGRANGQTKTCPDGGSEWKPLAYFPEFATALSQAPPAPPNISEHASAGDATGGLIPYKNVPGLVGYYMSCLGLLIMCIPILGFIYGVVVMVLGIMGLKKAKAHPEVKGKVHCWIAIIGGFIELVVGVITSVLFIISLLDR